MLETGDLVLFTQRKPSAWWLLDKAIEIFTRSPYVHVGIVLVDPPFQVPRGTYLWESGFEGTPDPESGKCKLGVRLTDIGTILDAGAQGLFVRKCTLPIAEAKLRKIHADVFLKPYDVCLSDWLLATLRLDSKPQKTDRFWCSAFVAYVLTRLEWLPEITDWSIVRPCDLSSSSTYLTWTVAAYTRDEPFPRILGGPNCGVARRVALVERLERLGIPSHRVTDTQIGIGVPRGSVIVQCTASSYEVREPLEPREPRLFDSQEGLLRYLTEVLDAARMAGMF
jgi:hypothetical protein